MFLLHSSEDAHAFFTDYRQTFMTAVERGIQDSDDCHTHYAQHVIQDAVPYPATYRTHDIHYRITARAAQLFAPHPEVRIEHGPNHSLVLVFKNLTQVRFQKMDANFKFPTTNSTQREQDFRNPSAANLFGESPLESIYAAYRLMNGGGLRDLYLVGMDQNEGKWTYNVGRGQGEDPLDINFGQAPVVPVINPDELARPRQKTS